MLMSSHYNYRLFGIIDTEVVAGVMTSLFKNSLIIHKPVDLSIVDKTSRAVVLYPIKPPPC